MTALSTRPATRFRSPGDMTAPAPPETRGLARDEVRLLVGTREGITHTRFRSLPDHLRAGDLVVVNNSATLAAQVDGDHAGTGPVVVHVATPLDDGSWVVEVRSAPAAAEPVLDLSAGDVLQVHGVTLTLLAPYPHEGSSPSGAGNRLWRVAPEGGLADVLDRHGRPISYGYLDRAYPLSAYQTVFGHLPGSAEMPSAGRPFTDALVTRLVRAGVGVAPITLHTGVSSQEVGEGPQAERFAVPEVTARQVNTVRLTGGRVIAVGTTVARALESAVTSGGRVVGDSGWTDRVITPDDPARVIDGLITGWHDPEASHLLLVESVAGPELTQRAHDAAVAEGYHWHEFGDSALLLP
ncbi:S-adenosylmethionine:tRNA ribosyltransferase-isomerase [Ornithinicoccus hortensis]|uniref:S-adenosylmethionine:tRNA ribosyltransferase-isomerase n=1 Tax=Ornithinicoccus hortensis TaxID=82346 RepID=A0A542YWB8_9MICO|nr:S-adenosylmethionine:tRNA ribosyltransferase-isomerase [Ornithinicoccus hortensis]TQL52388.1 S-adenosylmethionine:tRNA ribosyltransferase-isomerase [Ornithinicoccus hortensis]